MNRTGEKFFAITSAARVGRKLDGDITPGKGGRQRLGRKKVPAGAAGGEQHERRGLGAQAGLPASAKPAPFASMPARGRSRVSASSMPMA